MYTGAAAVSRLQDVSDESDTVLNRRELARRGWTKSAVDAQLRARRWQQLGRAVVRHNGPLTLAEQRRVALTNCGPRALLTAFTGAEEHGLKGWQRDWIDVLVPAGARVVRCPGIPLRLHWTGTFPLADQQHSRSLHRLAPALLLAANSFESQRHACGILAAGVQQRLTDASRLLKALDGLPTSRHHHALRTALADIAQGAEALSEIDFARLCRRHGLPEPRRQAVRTDRAGRRRYLDAEWTTASGRTLVVEVDGALHLIPRRWWDDQMRQNEIVIGGSPVLRFPSVLVRFEEQLVVDQLRRGLARL